MSSNLAKIQDLEFDFLVIGAGSAGCAAAAGLANADIGTVAVLEAGLSDKVPQVKIPFGLLFTMGSKRDWKYRSAPQTKAGNRVLKVPRGNMIGGSSSINSMVWFRGRRDDFDNWNVKGWSWRDVESDFEQVEEKLGPGRLPSPHPLAENFARALGDNGKAPPTPERESAGVFHVNMRNGARWSSADAFLRPALKTGRLEVLSQANVNKVEFENGRAVCAVLTDGRKIRARQGVILSAGSIASPSILMRSGIGPAGHLISLGIEVVSDAPDIGGNLHDHPAIGLHHAGPNSGYGLVLNQIPHWMVSPFNWVLRRNGRLVSNFVEAGAFFHSSPETAAAKQGPDCQSHFIPYMVGHGNRSIVWGSGYVADVCVCRPVSRGRVRLTSRDAKAQPDIDLGILNDDRDLEILVAGLNRLREILVQTPFGSRAAPEIYPAGAANTHDEIVDYTRRNASTAYHPVGTVRMGDTHAPVSPRLKLRGIDRLWVADASIMPAITSANTNAPSILIGHRAAKFVAEDLGMSA